MKKTVIIAVSAAVLIAAGIFVAIKVKSGQDFDLNDPETWCAPGVKNDVSPEDAVKIGVGMSFERVVELIGRPLRDEGSGGWIMVWKLKNGDDFKVAFRRRAGSEIAGDLVAFSIDPGRRGPDYSELNAENGLDVIVWQMSAGSYSFGLMEHSETPRGQLDPELRNLIGVNAEQMKQILSSYSAGEDDVTVVVWQNPLSSYLPECYIDMGGEDMEAKKRAYVDNICKMLFD
ncbi:MAG: hypothetical protein J6U75_03625 [Clostridia bacterium]|nr:hypothetical protein [Clostridia bacterium]